jgi:F420-dependent oxidoreductase-like protein
MRIPPRSLVVLVGPSGSGKSYWAAANFRADQIVSSDALRALVGASEHDQRAGTDAFEILDTVVEKRLSRGLLTVVDTLGLDADRRAAWLRVARAHQVACHAVVFDTPGDVCRARNRGRSQPVPAKVLAAQIQRRDALEIDGFDEVHAPGPVEVVAFPATPRSIGQLDFGLHLSSFPSGREQLREIAEVAEAVGFSSIWVMDHMMQIPQVGQQWEDMLEGWTTLAWLAAHTTTVRLGVLVTAVTHRNLAHLAKIVATVDVLSGGRVTCGLGLGWWEHEHRQYGWEFPSTSDRYARLEDALQLLPLMWGPGSPSFKGTTIEVPETVCYPRPIQERVPILVGGSGPRRTLRLAAQYADACNLFGDPETVRRLVGVVHDHCRALERDPNTLRVTHLSTAVAEKTRRELDATVDRLKPKAAPPEAVLARLGAGTIDDQEARYAALAEAGVQTAIVALPDAATPGALETFAEVIRRGR